MEPQKQRDDTAKMDQADPGGQESPGDQAQKPDWRAIVHEEMVREEILKEDGRYLVYYRFRPVAEES